MTDAHRAETADNPFPPEYLRFFELFNAGDFHAAHDALEEIWMTNRSEFLKGLIQVAVGYYHLENGNIHGARRLWETALRYLTPYPSPYMGLDVERVRAFLRAVPAALPSVRRLPLAEAAALPIPRLALEPQRFSAD